MFLALNKKIMWLVVIWFAVLQAVSPFIHGHMGGDTPAQGHGLHIHVQEFVQVNDSVHIIKSAAVAHAIGVDDALVKSVDLLPSPLFTLLFVLFLLSLQTKSFTPSSNVLRNLPLYLRPQSGPRAPPLL